MSSLADLHRAVQATITSKRLGQPVFIRYLWHSPEKSNGILPALTDLVWTVGEWLGQPLIRICAVGSAAIGHISLTLEFSHGATALVGWSQSRAPGSGVDLMVIGNRGALYHDAGSVDLWADPFAPGNLPERAALQRWIEEALGTARPVERAKP
jgi:hypothetical protein